MESKKPKFREDWVKVPGFPVKVPPERAEALKKKLAESKANPGPPPSHGYGDPNAEFPGDRPEAYSANLTAEKFHLNIGDNFEDCIQAVIYADGTQSYGKLEPGYKPAPGHEVDAAGLVVRVAKPSP